MQREGKHVLSHAGIYLVARGVPGIIVFVSIPLFTRLLEPADYGRYALVIASANLINALLFQWLRLSVVRYLPAYANDPQRLKSTLVSAVGLLVGVMGIVAAGAWISPWMHAWRPVICPCWIFLSVQAIFDLCGEYARATLRPWRYMMLQVSRSSATVILGALLIYLGFHWSGPLAGATIGMALATAWVWRTDWMDVRPLLDREIFTKLCEYGIPLSVTVALAVVIGSSDRFLIAWYLGEKSAGVYAVAADFTSQTLSLLMMVIQLAMFPLAVRAFEQHGKQAAQEQMRTNASLLLAVALPCVVGLVILAPGIAGCFLGRSYRAEAAHIMPLVALGTFLAGFKAYHFDVAFQFAHRTIFQVWIVLVAAVANILLNVIAIPRWGINGSAVASVLAYVVSITLTIYFGRRHFVLPFPLRGSVQVCIAAGAMALLLYPLAQFRSPIAVIAEILGGAILYAVGLLGCNFLELRDLLKRKLVGRGMPQHGQDHQTVAASRLAPAPTPG